MHHAIQRYGGLEVELHKFLNSAPDGGDWSASRPVRFTPGEGHPVSTEWEDGWAPELALMRW